MAEHKSLTEALVAFQAELPHVDKTAENPHFRNRFAPLEDIVKVVLPALAKHGLAWSAAPTMKDGQFVLEYRLMHTNGDALTGDYPLGGANAQQRGSELTYAKRYALCAVTGVTPGGEDDDGNAASQAPMEARAVKRVEAKQDWLGKLDAAVSKEDARAVWQEAEAAGELLAVLPDGRVVRDVITARAAALPKAADE